MATFAQLPRHHPVATSVCISAIAIDHNLKCDRDRALILDSTVTRT